MNHTRCNNSNEVNSKKVQTSKLNTRFTQLLSIGLIATLVLPSYIEMGQEEQSSIPFTNGKRSY